MSGSSSGRSLCLFLSPSLFLSLSLSLCLAHPHLARTTRSWSTRPCGSGVVPRVSEGQAHARRPEGAREPTARRARLRAATARGRISERQDETRDETTARRTTTHQNLNSGNRRLKGRNSSDSEVGSVGPSFSGSTSKRRRDGRMTREPRSTSSRRDGGPSGDVSSRESFAARDRRRRWDGGDPTGEAPLRFQPRLNSRTLSPEWRGRRAGKRKGA